jgi:solute:Na+ symporter, SSS family
VQLIFSVFGAPFWAIFLLGMSTRRTNQRGAIAGFLSGTALALVHLLATSFGWLRYGSVMSANFHVAIYAFCTAITVGWLVSLFDRASSPQTSTGSLVFEWRAGSQKGSTRLLWVLSAILIAACFTLNWIWR